MAWEDPLQEEIATQGWKKHKLESRLPGEISVTSNMDFPGGSHSKASVYNAGDLGSSPGLGRFPGEGNGNPTSTVAWKIPWTEEPGRARLWSLKESDTTERLPFPSDMQMTPPLW